MLSGFLSKVNKLRLTRSIGRKPALEPTNQCEDRLRVLEPPFIFEILEPRFLLSASWGMPVGQITEPAMAHSIPYPMDAVAIVQNVDPGLSLEPDKECATVLDTTLPGADLGRADYLLDNDPEQWDTTQQPLRRELVLIDAGVQGHQQLLEDLLAQRNEAGLLDVIVLDSDRDGIAQITAALANYADLNGVHFVSHGSDQGVQIGNTWLGNDNLDAYAREITRWADALVADADLLFYGCNLAGGGQGRTLLDAIGTLTGADVAASTDDTGYAGRGGDWELEYADGAIETGIVFTADILQSWTGLLNTAPIITLPGPPVNYNENDPATVIDSTATVVDVDSANFNRGTLTVSFSAGGTVNDQLSLVEGVVTIMNGITVMFNGNTVANIKGGTAGMPLEFAWTVQATPAAAQAVLRQVAYHNTSGNPDTTPRIIDFVITDGDGGTSNTAQQTVNVTLANDPPVKVNNEGSAVSEGGMDTLITTELLYTDPEQPTSSVTYTVTSGPANGQLELTTDPGVPITSFTQDDIDNNRLVYVHDGSDTSADLFNFDVDDGQGNILSGQSFSITVTAVNDASVLAAIEGSALAYTENDGAVSLTSTLTVSDADDTNIESAIVKITSNYQNGQDILAFSDTTNIVGSWDAATGTLNLVGTDTLENYQAALRSVTYQNTSDDPSTSTRVVSFTVNDGDADSHAVTRDVMVKRLNNPPTAISLSSSVVEENTDTRSGYSVGILSTADLDSGDTAAYSIVGGTDQDSFSIGGASVNELILTDGVLDFERQSSYQVIVRVTDSGGLSHDEIFTVDVNDQNEPPVVNNQSFNVNANSTNGTGVETVAATDPDTGDSLTYSITAGNIGGAFTINDSTGEITVANSAALDFETNPSFSLTVQVEDSGTLTDTATVTINLKDVNEPPIIFVPGADDSSGPPSPFDGNSPEQGSSDSDVLDIQPVSGSDTGEPDGGPMTPTILLVPAKDTAAPDNSSTGNFSQPEETGDHTPPPAEPAVDEASSQEASEELSKAESGDMERESQSEGRGEDRATNQTEASRMVELVHANAAMWSQIESGKRQMDQAARIQQKRKEIVVGMVTATSASLTTGYLIWLLRGGSLLASFLAATPLWRSFDPLPVLASWKMRKQRRRPSPRGAAFERDDEPELEALFGCSDENTQDQTGRTRR